MGVMLPQLTDPEKQTRWVDLQKNTVYPVSTQWALTVSGTTYPTADASTLGQYATNTLQQKTAYGIIGIRLSNFLKTITDGIVIAVSYSPTFTLAANNAVAGLPDDSGNVIYRAVCAQGQFNESIWYKNGSSNNNLFVEANRVIYVHQWASTAAIAAASMTAQGFLTIFAEFTGIRT